MSDEWPAVPPGMDPDNLDPEVVAATWQRWVDEGGAEQSRRQVVTISVNGVGLAQFAADTFNLDISDDTVTMTCAVPDTQSNPVTIDPRAESLLRTVFTRRNTGERVTLADLAYRSKRWTLLRSR